MTDQPTLDDLDKVLIDLYESGMLHGEAQANSVLPTPAQRETVILTAKQSLADYIQREQVAAIKVIGYRLDNHIDMGGSAQIYWKVIEDYAEQLSTIKTPLVVGGEAPTTPKTGGK